MTTSLEELLALMEKKEGEVLEFKEAKSAFDKEALVDYCVALANEGGGKLILGVTNARPRKIVGTQAFQKIEEIKLMIFNKVRLKVQIDELNAPGGRVLIFNEHTRRSPWLTSIG